MHTLKHTNLKILNYKENNMKKYQVLGKNIGINARNGDNLLPVIECDGELYDDFQVIEHGLQLHSSRIDGQVWATEGVQLLPDSNIDGRLKRIHVNQHNILHNTKVGTMVGTKLKPLITMKVGNKAVYCDSVIFLGAAWFVYNTRGLSCGAKVYIETKADIMVLNPDTFRR